MIYLALLNIIYNKMYLISLNNRVAIFPNKNIVLYRKEAVRSRVDAGMSFVVGELKRWKL